MRILVTGATGLVGRALLARLGTDGRHQVQLAARRRSPAGAQGMAEFVVGEFDAETSWQEALAGVEVVVHLAGRAHQVPEASPNPVAAFRRVNVEGTLRLAQVAAAQGAKRFIFISSVKVNGEGRELAYTEVDQPSPQDDYGRSKHEAEACLRGLSARLGMETVVIRPPLVYGPGVRANFRSLLNWVHRGIPLPLGAVRNRRSFVGVDNLADMIVTCIDHPAAGNETFLVSDGEDLSTPELLHRLGRALEVPVSLMPMPTWVLRAGAALLGRRGAIDRLCGSLQVDITKARTLLGWVPPLSVDQSLARTADAFRRDQRHSPP